jgi:hypothetical protein
MSPLNIFDPEDQENSILEMLESIEQEVIDLGYGTVQVSVIIQSGTPILDSLTIAKTKKIKYSGDNLLNEDTKND